MKMHYHIRNVRERLAKNLVDKGVCTTGKQNLLVFDMTTHPVTDTGIKLRLMRKVQDSLLGRWAKETSRMDQRLLALIYMSHASDVLENAFAPLSDEDYATASRRVRELKSLDFEKESAKEDTNELVWAVVAVLSK